MKQLKTHQLLGYSSGSLGTGIFSTVPSILLLYYMTDILGIPAQLAAIGIFIPKLWDMITDPLIGYISDKTRSHMGRRRPYLIVGSWLMPVCFMLIFLVPDFEKPLYSFYYVLVMFILSATTYTLFAVPYTAMPAEMSDDPIERTKIISYRMTVVMVGVLSGAAFSPAIIEYFGGGKTGYAYMAVIFSLICFISMQITSLTSKYIPLATEQSNITPLSRQITLIIENRPFLILLGTYLFQIVGVGVFTSMVPFFVVHVLQENQGHIGILFLLSLGMSTLSIPLWGIIGSRFGKIFSYVTAVIIYGVSLISFFLSSNFSYGPELGMVLLGFGFAGLQVIPYSLLADVIRYDARLTGFPREAILTGIWTACEKTGFALGPLVAGTLLALFGFIENSVSGNIVKQTESVLDGILITVSLVPAFFVIVSVVTISHIKVPDITVTRYRKDIDVDQNLQAELSYKMES